MRTRWITAVAAATFLAIGLAPAAAIADETPVTAPAPAQSGAPLLPVATMEAQELASINAERAAAGVGPVTMNSWSQQVAQQHSQDMVATGTIFHNMTGFMDVARSVLGATALGENVAMDSTLAADDSLLFSDPPHQAILLDGRYNTVGVGVALDAKNWVYLTEDFAAIPGGGSAAPAAAPRVVAPVAPKVVAKPAPVVVKPAAPVVVTPPKPAPPVAPPTVAPSPVPATVSLAAPAVAAAPAASPVAKFEAAPLASKDSINPVAVIALCLLCLMALVAASALGRRLSARAIAAGREERTRPWRPTGLR